MALAEYQQRGPDNRDRDPAVKLLTRRGGSCTWSYGSTAVSYSSNAVHAARFDLRLIFIDADRGGNPFDGFFADLAQSVVVR